jgi:uncharacterized protein YcfJ
MHSKVLTTFIAMAFVASPAFAETVQDHYKTVYDRIPYTETVCNIVDVPIYGNVGGGASGTDVLTGMIIGGLIGKGVTDKDKGAAAGAVIGGMIAADKKQSKEGIVGYRQEERCKNITRYKESSKEVYSHSTVSFYHDGRQYSLRFKK